MRSIAILAAFAAFSVGVAPMIVVDQANAQTTQTDTKSMWEKIKGSWNQTKGAVKEQWGKLTDDDLDVIAGKQEQLEGMIQQRYGYQKDQARKEINDWFDRQSW